ncbi:MAG TPA: hypothetical protein VN133_10685 [Humibacter sp.]|nr:hypothetical protein [Humibacter sp.]
MVAVTTAALEQAGMLASPEGQRALFVARRLEAAGMDTGSSIAALIREHAAQLDAAIAKAKIVADPLDELLEKRRARLGQ